METETLLKTAEQKFKSSEEHLKGELAKIRTGRAHPSMLDGLTVEAYGQAMPLLQVASITVPEPQLLQITPFDPNNLQAIAVAIRENQTLGLNPIDDGRVVRVTIPPLTSERRQQIVKQLGEKAEECMISLRNARHEVLHTAEQLKKDKQISEDELKRFTKQLDELIASRKREVDELVKNKEKDILTI